jgi:serine/threonine-protein phosphatase CPPED1
MNTSGYRRRALLGILALCAGLLVMPVGLSATEDDGPQTFTFVQLCDTQLGMGGYEHDAQAFRQAVKQINALQPDFVLICGDLVNEATDGTYADFKQIRAGLNCPCFSAPGNHDVGNEPTQQSLEYYRSQLGPDYYHFDHHGYAFVVVNTSLWKAPVAGETEQQEAWLATTLQQAEQRGQGIFVVGHHPLFLAQPGEADEYMNLPKAARGRLLALLEQHGVTAWVAGHTHRLVLNEYNGIPLVHGETTSKNFDERPLGFRVWHVNPGQPPAHEFVALQDF